MDNLNSDIYCIYYNYLHWQALFNYISDHKWRKYCHVKMQESKENSLTEDLNLYKKDSQCLTF